MDYGVTSEDVDYDETTAGAATGAATGTQQQQQQQQPSGNFQPPPDDSLDDDDDENTQNSSDLEEENSAKSDNGEALPVEENRHEPSGTKRRRNSDEQVSRRWSGANRQSQGREYLPCRCLVPDDIAGHIIGVRGTGLHRLQKLSGANVHVSKPSETPKSLVDRVVTFIGNPQQVDTAVTKLLEMLRRDKPQSRGIFVLLIPEVTSFAFLDSRGQRLRSLEGEYHCEVTIAKAPIEGMRVRPVIIKGSDEATAAVISKVQETVESVVRSKRIPLEEASALMADRTNERGSQPPPPPPPPPGPPVDTSEVAVPWVPGLEKIPRDQDSGFPLMMVIDRRYSSYIIGKSGKCVTEIEHCSGARIQFEKADQFPPNPRLISGRNEVMVLRGTMAEKSRGMVKILEMLDVKDDKFSELMIPANKTRNVIGRGGDTINWICKTTGCNVQVQKCETGEMPTRFVTFEGSLEERVKAALMVLVAIELSFMPAPSSPPDEPECNRREHHQGEEWDRNYSPGNKKARHHHQSDYQSHGRSTESPRGHRGSYEGVSESWSEYHRRGSLDSAAVQLGTAADRLGSDVDHDEASYFSVVVGRNTVNSWVKAGFLDELSRRSGAHIEIGKDVPQTMDRQLLLSGTILQNSLACLYIQAKLLSG